MLPATFDFVTYKVAIIKGNQAGDWGVAVRGNWKITFRFEDGDVVNVNLEDYH